VNETPEGPHEEARSLTGLPVRALSILDDGHAAVALAETVASLKAHTPTARVVVLADHLGPETMMRAVQAGVDGLCRQQWIVTR